MVSCKRLLGAFLTILGLVLWGLSLTLTGFATADCLGKLGADLGDEE